MKKIITTILFLFLSITFSFGQDLDYNNNAESIEICTAIQGSNFSSVSNADDTLDKILAVIGASKRFVLQECSNINNAVAITYNGVRYIMYDPKFMKSLSGSNQWSNMFILAHEVGHHINGHTVDVLASNNQNKPSLATQRQQELESDEFAGFVLGRLGASLSEASSTINSLANNSDDSYSTHPSKNKRLAAVKKGWNESGGYIDSSDLDSSKGKTVDSKYSNSRFAGVEYQKLTNYYSDAVYEGYVYVKSGEPFGYGKIYGTNGDVYEGEMAGGKRNGYGVEKYINGDVKEGFWVNNNFSGYGVETIPSTGKFIGNFSYGALQGKGKAIYNSGNVYEGDFVKGDFNGFGKYSWANGAVYEGDWVNGLFNGKGIYKYADGGVYEGDWVNNKMTGKGKYTYTNGDVCEGDWVNGIFNGKGKYTYANGDVYEGDWVNNKMTGKGTKTYVDGRVEKGSWKDGVFLK